MKVCAVLTIAQVAKSLGWSVRRTRATLRKMDGELHGMLLRNIAKKGERPRYTVTLESLKMAAPQWFANEDLSERVEMLEEENERLSRITESLRMRVATLEGKRGKAA